MIKKWLLLFLCLQFVCKAMCFEGPEYDCFRDLTNIQYNSLKDIKTNCYTLLEQLWEKPIPDMRSNGHGKCIYVWLKKCNVEQARDLCSITSNLCHGVRKDIGDDKRWSVHWTKNNGNDTIYCEDGSRVGLFQFFHQNSFKQRCSLDELKIAVHNLLEEMMRGWKESSVYDACDTYFYKNEVDDEQKCKSKKYPWFLDEKQWFFATKYKIIPYEESVLKCLIRLLIGQTDGFECCRSKDNSLLYLWLGINGAQEIIKKLGLQVQFNY